MSVCVLTAPWQGTAVAAGETGIGRVDDKRILGDIYASVPPKVVIIKIPLWRCLDL